MPIETLNVETVYKGWATYSVATFRVEDGKTVRREVADHGQAACVLAYDPEHRTAMLVRQFRAPVFLTAGEPELLEAVAGMIEDGDAADAARREAKEEVGLRLGSVEFVTRAWTTPGSSTERIDLFLAPYSAADRTGPGGGVAHEHEDVTAVELPLTELAEMADAGRLSDMKTFALVQTLRLRHPALFLP